MNDGERHIIDLYISDNMVKKEQNKHTIDFAMPMMLLSIRELFNIYFYVL